MVSQDGWAWPRSCEEVDDLSQPSGELNEWDVPFIQLGSHYSIPPIVEAIIELRCELPRSTSLEMLEGAADRATFPTMNRHVEVSGTVNFTSDMVEGETNLQQTGVIFQQANGLRYVQARLDRFAYHALAPYDRWESFSREAWQCWNQYHNVLRPRTVTRFGVRFVNKIRIPSARVEIKDYLRTAIDVSPYLPQLIAGYFLQIAVPLPRFRATATVTSTIEPSESDSETVLILDIDTWQATDLDLGLASSHEEIQQGLDNLRLAKNYVFEACITDATRGLIR